ncbi:MAG: S49 family peptidase [Planctomycetota bacterium]
MSESEEKSPKNVRLVSAPEVLQIECVGPREKKKSLVAKVFTYLLVVIFISSIVANFYMAMLLQTRFTTQFAGEVIEEGTDESVVAVYEISGTIGPEASAQFGRFYRFLRDNENIKAVVLRVNSPGGTIPDSDRIYYMVRDIQEKLKRTVVVSQGNVAASGGYYVSAPAERIFAERSTITGSIGVIAIYPAFRGLTDKLGVEIITIRARQAYRWKARPEGVDMPDDRVLADLQVMMDRFHTQFTEVVKTHRPDIVETSKTVEITNAVGEKETIKEVNPYNGTIYRGTEALELKLIDEIGSLEDAVSYAAESAGVKSPKVIRYYRPPTLMEALGLPVTQISTGIQALENLTAPRILMMWKVD